MTGRGEVSSEDYMDIVLQVINPGRKKTIVAIKQEVGESAEAWGS